MSQTPTAPDRPLPSRRRAGLMLAAVACAGLGVLAPAPAPAAAQDPPAPPEMAPPDDAPADPAGWNSPRALRLVERAREQRQSMVVDSSMHSYRAQARGYVYFFMDREGEDLRSLVKADQIALEVMWQAPDRTRQHIVGQRDEKLLPTNIRYHLDHLTVVQDDFGDNIRMGDGDEVSEVVHPAAPGSDGVYEFLLTDSLTIRFPDGTGEVRVFELRVRPRRLDRPGFVGSLFVDQATGAIVRMNFSFTPASYVDPYIDYIRVSLDNSLWMGRHWLPYRQEMEIRREIPLLDFLAGSVIRGRFEVRDYDFNVEFGPLTFIGQHVTSASPAQREAFAFERGLLADIEAEGLTRSPALEDVETQVREVVEDRYLTGLAPLRFHLASISDAFRYNRAEGLFLGAGTTLRPSDDVRLRGAAGYAFGRREPMGALTAETLRGGGLIPSVSLYWNTMRDIGGHPGATPLENTITSLSGNKDYIDPFFARGAALTFRDVRRPLSPALTLRWEQHHQGADVVSDDLTTTDYRPVRGIDAGTLASVELALPFALPAAVSAEVDLTAGRLATRNFASADLSARRPFTLPGQVGTGELSVAGGWLSGDGPAQSLYLIGGRNTLPGHDYRAFVGDRYWLVRGETTVPVHAPWVGVRFIGAVGATYLSDRAFPEQWAPTGSSGVRASLGAGLSIMYDVMRIDLARGLDGGGWEAVFSVSPGLRPWI